MSESLLKMKKSAEHGDPRERAKRCDLLSSFGDLVYDTLVYALRK